MGVHTLATLVSEPPRVALRQRIPPSADAATRCVEGNAIGTLIITLCGSARPSAEPARGSL